MVEFSVSVQTFLFNHAAKKLSVCKGIRFMLFKKFYDINLICGLLCVCQCP